MCYLERRVGNEGPQLPVMARKHQGEVPMGRASTGRFLLLCVSPAKPHRHLSGHHQHRAQRWHLEGV